MNTADQDYDDDGYEDDDTQRENHNLSVLRKKAKEADKFRTENETLKSENATLKREGAMALAGIDLDTPMGKLFRKAYDGAPTVEDVKRVATEYGILAPQEDPAEQERQQALTRLGSASQGSSTAGGNTLTADAYATWPAEKRNALRTSHPREFEALKRGDTVTAPTGF